MNKFYNIQDMTKFIFDYVIIDSYKNWEDYEVGLVDCYTKSVDVTKSSESYFYNNYLDVKDVNVVWDELNRSKRGVCTCYYVEIIHEDRDGNFHRTTENITEYKLELLVKVGHITRSDCINFKMFVCGDI